MTNDQICKILSAHFSKTYHWDISVAWTGAEFKVSGIGLPLTVQLAERMKVPFELGRVWNLEDYFTPMKASRLALKLTAVKPKPHNMRHDSWRGRR